MASRTLFELFTLSIIFIKQTETRTLNEISNFAKDQKYSVDNTLVNNIFNKTDVSNRNGTVPMKDAQEKAYESKHDVEFSNTYIIEQMPNEEADADKLKTARQKEIKPSNKGLKPKTKLLPKQLTPLNNNNHFSKYEKKYIEEDNRMNLINSDLLETLALKTAIEKVKQELSETKYKLNDESLQNAAKEHLTHTKAVPRPKYSTTRHHKTNIRTTQSMTENSLIAKVGNGIVKIEHREKRNHKSPEKRGNVIDELQRPSEFKIASKHDNKLKYIDNKSHDALSLENEDYELIKHVDNTAEVWVSKQINLEYTPKHKRKFQKRKHQDDIVTKDKHSDKTKHNSKIKHDLETYQDKYKQAVKKKDEYERILDSGDNLNPDEVVTQTLEKHDDESRGETLKLGNRGSKLKHRLNKKPDTISLENDIYLLKNNLYDFKKDKVKVSKESIKLNKQILSQNYQNKKYNEISNTTKHIGKPKNKSEEVVSNIYKGNHKNKQYFITGRHTNILSEDERIFDSRDKLKVDEEDIRTVTKMVGRQADRQADEEATLDSSEEPFKQNQTVHLPFHILTIALDKKKKETKTLLDDLNTVLNGTKNLNSDVVLNQTIIRLVSSKIFDILTERVAGKMLKKLETMGGKNLLSKHQFKAKMEVKPDKVEQIGILFDKNGEMQVVMSRENVTETEKNNSGDIETFYLK